MQPLSGRKCPITRSHAILQAMLLCLLCVSMIIPLRGEARQVHSPSRKYERQFPIADPPKADFQDVKDALTSAKMLKATLDACESGIAARCGYTCSTEFGCSKCIPKNINATCAAAVAKDGQHLDIEWIADTGCA